MNFLYKIHSGFDGFYPRRIPERFIGHNTLRLGWARYLDAVELGADVWVYFHGPHAFDNGVYVKGFVKEIDWNEECVFLRIREYSPIEPLVDAETSGRIAAVVAPRYRQVFLYPTEWIQVPECTIDSTASTCADGLCEHCPVWSNLSVVPAEAARTPQFIRHLTESHTTGCWVIPRRCYWTGGFKPGVRQTTEIFSRFKVGEEAVAFPLTLALYRALCQRQLADFDCIVPIPLSPSKARAGELNRTHLLATQLGKRLGAPVREAIHLSTSISKRAYEAEGYSRKNFEDAYYEALVAEAIPGDPRRILLLDDVSTHGTTLRCALGRLRAIHPSAEVHTATAAQMIVKAAVADETSFLT